MKPRIPLLNVFFLMCVAVTVFTISDARAQDKIRIGISSSSPGFLPTVIAEHKGFYTKYDLVSEHVRISLAIAMNALGSGDLDYAITMAQLRAKTYICYPAEMIKDGLLRWRLVELTP